MVWDADNMACVFCACVAGVEEQSTAFNERELQLAERRRIIQSGPPKRMHVFMVWFR